MRADAAGTVRARRYLLGEGSDDEREIIEQEYLAREESVDRIAAAEDDLIEDYLTGRFNAAERERFERRYLSVPHRRARVETVRRLMARASQAAPAQPLLAPGRLSMRGTRRTWLALAASLLLVAVASVMIWRRLPAAGQPGQAVAATQPADTSRSAAPDGSGSTADTSGVFAVAISPVAVRSAGEDPDVVIPPAAAMVVLHLEGDADNRTLVARRANIRTVAGEEVWKGSVTAGRDLPAGAVAQLEVPAENLPADDYVITLFGADAGNTEHEWNQYVLRVRSR